MQLLTTWSRKAHVREINYINRLEIILALHEATQNTATLNLSADFVFDLEIWLRKVFFKLLKLMDEISPATSGKKINRSINQNLSNTCLSNCIRY